MYRIAVLVSGTGSNFLSIAEAISDGRLPNTEIVHVISDKKEALALEKAESKGIPTSVVDKKNAEQSVSDQILAILQKENPVDLVVLAGFLSILEGKLLEVYAEKMINIHPSLIPSFCGNGMYGLKVHQAAIDYGVKMTGCTVHLVSEETDGGAIVLQKVVPVETDDAKVLQQAVLVKEHEAMVEAVSYFSTGQIQIEGRHVRILKNEERA